jgi:hypothetical protein
MLNHRIFSLSTTEHILAVVLPVSESEWCNLAARAPKNGKTTPLYNQNKCSPALRAGSHLLTLFPASEKKIQRLAGFHFCLRLL